MAKYQIIATIENIDLESESIQIRGVSKYCFEKEKDKEYWNIFEKTKSNKNPENAQALMFLDIKAQLGLSKIGMEVQHLLDHAFIERKKLKFELSINSDSSIITSLSHAPN